MTELGPRFLVFVYKAAAPLGGARDLVGAAETMTSAAALVRRHHQLDPVDFGGHFLDLRTNELSSLDNLTLAFQPMRRRPTSAIQTEPIR